MSFVFSKNKEKRSRSSTGETNSSFVKNVTSRVSGFLPAGITKWFSSPSSSSANGSAAVADGTDSSTEDEAPESPSMIQPPAKRMRYSSSIGKYSHLTTTETTTTSNVITETGSVLYSSIQSPPGRNTFRREPNFVSTPIRIDDTIMERSDADNQIIQHAAPAIGQSGTMKRKSLFDTEKQKESALIACAKTAARQVKDMNQPHFKPHLLIGSPFYPGRTMYGGASASSPYMNQPNIIHRKMTYVNESKDTESAMSSSSRRVMDLLENYSSPLIEAKRIPRYEMSDPRDTNRSLPLSTSTRQRDNNFYKTQELYIPTKASLIRMKARNRLMESTKAARQIIASHSSTYMPHKPYNVELPKTDRSNIESGSAKSQTKLKSRLTRTNRGENAFEMPHNVDLPSAVLNIDKNKLPKISFGSTPDTIEKTNESRTEHFKFSTPLQATTEPKTTATRAPPFDLDSPEKAMKNKPFPKFSFGEQTQDTANKTKPAVPEVPPKVEPAPAKKSTDKTVITFAKSAGGWECSGCWVVNTAETLSCGCCGAKQPSKLQTNPPSESTSKCNNCKLTNRQPNSDVCANCEKMRANTKPAKALPPLVAKKANSSKWTCNECWVANDKTIEKCLCCGSRNPHGPSTPVPDTDQPALTALPRQQDWRCEVCFITNKPTIEKCVACNGAKPGTKPEPKTLMTSTNNSKSDNKMAEIIKAQLSYWECKICLASNDNEKDVCMCCEAPKNPQASKPSIFTNFKFNSEISSSFKFGIDPKVQESNLAMKVNDSPKPNNIEESETNNNVVPKFPSFGSTFTASKQNAGIIASSKDDEERKPSFSFGIPKQNANTGFTPITPPPVAKLPDIVKPAEEVEKPQEVPSISFKAPEATKRSTGLFSSLEKPQNAMNEFLNNPTEPKKSSPTKSNAVLDAPQFSFSASPAKPSTGNLFTPPAPTALTNSLTTQVGTGSSLTMNMFSKPEASAAPSTGFFTKPETTLAPSAPSPSTLFQNSRAPSGPAAPPAAAPAAAPPLAAPPAAAPPGAAPQALFSFGSNQSAAAAPTNEVKKYNFSFGSNTTTSTFSATPQTNSNFSLPTGNQISNGPANSLGGNAISMAGNPLGVNGGNRGGNGMLGSGSASMFDAPAPAKERTSMWPTSTEQTNQANPFTASAPVKPFSFGATQAPVPFGAQPANPQQPQMFGASAQPAQNLFGMNQSNAGQPSMFGNPAASQPAPMFGAHNTSAAPAVGLFGQASASPFGASNASTPAFEAPAPAPATFNFSAQQAAPVVFGFGQHATPSMQAMEQPQMQQPNMQQPGMQQPGMQQPGIQQPGMQQQGMQQPGMQQPGMFFGATAPPGQMQFAMGSAPSGTGARRVRKAFRRTQQR